MRFCRCSKKYIKKWWILHVGTSVCIWMVFFFLFSLQLEWVFISLLRVSDGYIRIQREWAQIHTQPIFGDTYKASQSIYACCAVLCESAQEETKIYVYFIYTLHIYLSPRCNRLHTNIIKYSTAPYNIRAENFRSSRRSLVWDFLLKLELFTWIYLLWLRHCCSSDLYSSWLWW